eukprot:m.144552 g.144552  ORF g.144552 m.144552 type:complete len:96 (+) comp14133_c0_seq1:76-363(+)
MQNSTNARHFSTFGNHCTMTFHNGESNLHSQSMLTCDEQTFCCILPWQVFVCTFEVSAAFGATKVPSLRGHSLPITRTSDVFPLVFGPVISIGSS